MAGAFLGDNPTDVTTIDEALDRLYDASIIEFAGDSIRAVTMHRLVQRVIREHCHLVGTYAQVLAREPNRIAT